jgi:hypothetical protein
MRDLRPHRPQVKFIAFGIGRLAAIPPPHTNTANNDYRADCEYYEPPRILTLNGYHRQSKDCYKPA